MTRVTVNPGVCGFTATITVEKIDKKRLACKIDSKCKAVDGLNTVLSEINKFEILKPKTDSEIWLKLCGQPLHLSCPIPVAIIKAIEAEAGLALARDVSIHFKTPDES